MLGAGLGALTGTIGGLFPGLGGYFLGGLMGGFDSWMRGSTFFSGLMGGLVGGAGNGLVSLRKFKLEGIADMLSGFDVGLWIQVLPNFSENIKPSGKGQKPCMGI